jgi:hypothetical protein
VQLIKLPVTNTTTGSTVFPTGSGVWTDEFPAIGMDDGVILPPPKKPQGMYPNCFNRKEVEKERKSPSVSWLNQLPLVILYDSFSLWTQPREVASAAQLLERQQWGGLLFFFPNQSMWGKEIEDACIKKKCTLGK